MTKRSARWIVGWVAAGAFILGGAAMIVVGAMTPVSFGWFAYQPLANATFAPGSDAVILSRTAAIGLAVFTLGLLVLAFLAGSRRSKR